MQQIKGAILKARLGFVEQHWGRAGLDKVVSSLPEEDQRTLTVAGDSIDTQLLKLVQERYPQANVTVYMVREWKEKHSFVGDSKQRVMVTAPVKGVPTELDITNEMRAPALAAYLDRSYAFFTRRRTTSWCNWRTPRRSSCMPTRCRCSSAPVSRISSRRCTTRSSS